ncbi:hypothetical protein B0T24DRAFT_205331 [Lasiosphaeria ovina]|uniref:C2H2-type domain-containing protein n=1 Tax=Lasiosphaeria ovina TaxID=92902 RepID=A0AAE0N9G6_9PEZI|nr:hypothetical protein B0T24DRAFT_205331 [Lasiosphaeria ovina]
MQRLSLANALRREQLIYWRDHPDQEGLTGPAVMDSRSVKSGTASLFSKNTVAKSDILGVASSLQGPQVAVANQPHTIYADTVIGGSHSSRVPDVPGASLQSETFECPYCRLNLNSAVMQDRMAWKRHVFRDLRPYTCSYPSCPSSDKLYPTKHDWIYHEAQLHRRKWVCRDCHLDFPSPGEMSAHLELGHPGRTSSSSHLEIYEMAVDDADPAECPLCPMKSNLKAIFKHLARHMEELSLFALPRLIEDEDNEEQANENDGEARSHLSFADVDLQSHFEFAVDIGPGNGEQSALVPNLQKNAARINEGVWESYKDIIIGKYTNGMSLADVAIYMEEEHGFVATKRQYVRRIGTVWGVRKYRARMENNLGPKKERRDKSPC